jgi:hypothetical protein
VSHNFLPNLGEPLANTRGDHLVAAAAILGHGEPPGLPPLLTGVAAAPSTQEIKEGRYGHERMRIGFAFHALGDLEVYLGRPGADADPPEPGEPLPPLEQPFGRGQQLADLGRLPDGGAHVEPGVQVRHPAFNFLERHVSSVAHPGAGVEEFPPTPILSCRTTPEEAV